jgi:hypothetical protein
MASGGAFLEGNHDVTMDGAVVGRVSLHREGLYYRISCRCRVTDEKIHRLYADGEKLGVLIPEHGNLTLETKVAAKRLKEGCAFSLDENRSAFIPICPGETFAHLDKLRSGRLGFRDGIPGLIL